MSAPAHTATAARKFQFVAGEVCLDFANTVGGTRGPAAREHLKSYPDLIAWCRQAGLVNPSKADAAIRAVVITLLGLPAMYAIGTLFAAGVLRYGEIGPVVQIVRGTFVLACGITFPVAMLPAWAQLGAALLPPTYIVADIRAVLLRGFGLADVAGDVLITLGLTVVIAFLAVFLFGALERSARRTGMLSRF